MKQIFIGPNFTVLRFITSIPIIYLCISYLKNQFTLIKLRYTYTHFLSFNVLQQAESSEAGIASCNDRDRPSINVLSFTYQC